jgi:hypothetical protein
VLPDDEEDGIGVMEMGMGEERRAGAGAGAGVSDDSLSVTSSYGNVTPQHGGLHVDINDSDIASSSTMDINGNMSAMLVLRDFFYSLYASVIAEAVACVPRPVQQLPDKVLLFSKCVRNRVPFHLYHVWLRQEMHNEINGGMVNNQPQ